MFCSESSSSRGSLPSCMHRHFLWGACMKLDMPLSVLVIEPVPKALNDFHYVADVLLCPCLCVRPCVCAHVRVCVCACMCV